MDKIASQPVLDEFRENELSVFYYNSISIYSTHKFGQKGFLH